MSSLASPTTRVSFFAPSLTLRQILTKRRWRLGVVAAIAGLALLGILAPSLTSAAPAPSGAASGARALPVAVQPVELLGSYRRTRSYSGELRPRRASELGFETAGRMTALAVDEGSRVAAGDVLAELESERVRARLASLEARRAREEARLDELVRGPRAQVIEAARAETRSLEESLDLAVLLRERRRVLVEDDAASGEALDLASTTVETTAASLEAARARLDELEEGTRAEVVEQQRAILRELDAEIALARVEIDDRRLVAPFDGVVTQRLVDEGVVVDPGQSVLRLIEDGALEARLGLPLEQAARLAVGEDVVLDVRGEPIGARIRALVPEMDGATRTVDAILVLSEEDSRRSIAGDVARLELTEDVEARGTWLPTTALVTGTRGRWAAYAVVPDASPDGSASRTQSIVERRELDVLHTERDRVFVDGLLSPGELLLIEGAHRVVPGQRVSPAEAAAPSGVSLQQH